MFSRTSAAVRLVISKTDLTCRRLYLQISRVTIELVITLETTRMKSTQAWHMRMTGRVDCNTAEAVLLAHSSVRLSSLVSFIRSSMETTLLDLYYLCYSSTQQ